MPTRVPNTSLRDLIAEADWTNREFARAVNRVGRELGLTLNYDESSVWHWLGGATPRKRVHPAICEALARRLGRPITVKDAGIGTVPETATSAGDTVSGLIELGSADMDPSRRATLGAATLFSAALAIPGWRDITGRFEAFGKDPNQRIGHGEVAAVAAVTQHISDLDDQFGGRFARPMAAAFLVNTIAPYLRADAAPDVRAAMLSAAADHCYLTGYMAMDERADGLAQRYYVKALELAGGADDYMTYCTVLRGMSVQAVDLGHGKLSMRLADAAADSMAKAGPRKVAFLAGQQAHAAAVLGDRAGALTHIQRAERAMAEAEAREQTFGSYDPASLHYHLGQVRYALGDLKGSIQDMQTSDRLRPSANRRTMVRYNALLAERKLQAGRLEEACRDWNAVLDEYPKVQSGRADDRFHNMIAVLRPHKGNPYARQVLDRARTIARTKTATAA